MFRELTRLRNRPRLPRDDSTRQIVCTVRAVDVITSRPVAGAKVRLWRQAPPTQLEFVPASPRPATRAIESTTDEKGISRATLRLPATLRHAYFLPERRVIIRPDLMVEVTAPGYATSACPLSELLGSEDYRFDALPLPALLVMLQPWSRAVMAGHRAAWPVGS